MSRLRRSLALPVAGLLSLGGLVVAHDPLAAHAVVSCTGSTSATLRSKVVDFDQCHRQTFVKNATTYTIQVWYTEQNTTANQNRCTAAEGAARCEHAISNIDDVNGDNVTAIGVANEAASALSFYIDRGIGFPPAGQTTLTVYIGEDPRTGGVITPMSLYWDDDSVDSNDVLWKRLLAYHETMHLIQDVYDDTSGGWGAWYGEGVARAVEDRVDAALDADTGHLFIPQVNSLMSTVSDRTSSSESTSYPSFLWWTWLFDQYRGSADVAPVIGWDAIRDFYTKLGASTDQIKAVRDFVSGRGGNLDKDWLDYSLSLWAYKRSPSDQRLTYLDNEIRNSGNAMTGNTVISGGPAFNSTVSTPMVNARSVQFFEMPVASQCAYTTYRFDGQGKNFGMSVMTATAAGLRDRWSAITSGVWTRTVATAGLTSLTGAVSGLSDTGSVKVGYGCVTPSISIERPTTAAFEMVGTPAKPRRFIVQVKVTGPNGEPIAGLTKDAFTASFGPLGGGSAINATVVQGSYVQDRYWLLVQAPNGAAGAQIGTFYDLRVALGTQTATQPQSVVYLERAQDEVIVLDRSGSMADASKIDAARKAATLFTEELSASDQGGYVSFDTDATLNTPLKPVDAAQRAAMEAAIGAATPGAFTSIGDGMLAAAQAHDAGRDPKHVCGFVLLSDGYENEPQYWADVKSQVVDNGCPVHAIALGPEANEGLMQQIAASVPGGSYDYAPTAGSVPVNTSSSSAGASSGGGGAGGTPGATASLGWENNLSRLYDAKQSQLADRDRLATFVDIGQDGCRTEDARVAFESRLPGSVVVDNGYADNGVGVKALGESHYNTGGVAGGTGIEADLVDAELNFDFTPGCQVEFRYSLVQGFARIRINGEYLTTEFLPSLDGVQINGTQVRVYVDGDEKGQTGRVVVTGDVQDFAIQGRGLTVDDVIHRTDGRGRQFEVDATTDQLVVALGWQHAAAAAVTLVDPVGNVAPGATREVVPGGTGEVWTIPNPVPGPWTMVVDGLDQEYFASVTARSDLGLRLAIGTPIDGAVPGVEVPLAAFFAGPNGGVIGARVVATVADPAKRTLLVEMYDDGNHDDGEADDGVYGASYSATAAGDTPGVDGRNPDGHGFGENDGVPTTVGSYTVSVVGISGVDRREDEGGFAIDSVGDGDQDGLDDGWEKSVGLDPRDSGDWKADRDNDGLIELCEFRLGGDPLVGDTDTGGELDGSEATFDGVSCIAETDPTDAIDDRVSALTGVSVRPAALSGVAHVEVTWGAPERGTLRSVDLYRSDNGGPWSLIVGGLVDQTYVDHAVLAGMAYAYRVVPTVTDSSGIDRRGTPVESSVVIATSDPYAPAGSVLINDGAEITTSLALALTITADDSVGDGDGSEAMAGTPAELLEMRFSLTDDFTAVAWMPYTDHADLTLPADTVPGDTVTVYAQFRDPSGNVSTTALGATDSVVYQP